MVTSERECLDALREAADRLGKSPTKAEYEELGLTPASATILRTVGGWNKAKEKAGLTTAPSTGSRVSSKPEGVELPDGTQWEELSVDQRWHYRNVEWNTERTLRRRAGLRKWVNDRKAKQGCAECGETDAACLDFHHRNPETKEMAVGTMITHGFGKDRLRDEIAKCEVLCANCHRKEHHERRETEAGTTDHRQELRDWVYEYKLSSEGCRQCEETDPDCLVFHHPGEKVETVAKLVTDRRPIDIVQKEVKRCILLCSNCHRRKHFDPPRTKE